jgi:hypothetical protein
MLNKFLGRLPKEDHIGYWIPYDRILQSYPIDQTTGELLIGEQFFFAFETEEITINDIALNQQYVESSLPMEIITSSDLDFKVGDKIIFEDRIKMIVGVAVLLDREDINIGIGFNPRVRIHHRRLTLS